MVESSGLLTVQEKEKAILEKSMKNAQQRTGRKKIRNSNVSEIIVILEDFLRTKGLVCYGGIALNNILPQNERFYDFESEIPDYDFFSPRALLDAKQLADIFYDAGYETVEAKSGIHEGTYKLFVDFFQVADITQMNQKVFNKIHKRAIYKKGILYAPANLLRMMSYAELSRPEGVVSRWTKVVDRLSKLNKYYPINASRCDSVDFQRDFEHNTLNKRDVYYIVRDALIDEDVVFFGGWACSLYGRYMSPQKNKHLNVELPDFDALSKDPFSTATAVKNRLLNDGIKKVRIKKKHRIEEFLPEHYEIMIGGKTVCFIFQTENCYSYNIIKRNNRPVKIATIDTMLKFYLAFVYLDKTYFDENRLLCMANYLLQVQLENKLKQKGILKRFTIDCYGEQKQLETIRGERHDMYLKLKDTPNRSEYEKYFLKYAPHKTNTCGQWNRRKMTKSKLKSKSKSKTKSKTKSKKKNTRKNKWGIF